MSYLYPNSYALIEYKERESAVAVIQRYPDKQCHMDISIWDGDCLKLNSKINDDLELLAFMVSVKPEQLEEAR